LQGATVRPAVWRFLKTQSLSVCLKPDKISLFYRKIDIMFNACKQARKETHKILGLGQGPLVSAAVR
jgi:hypothetical protein